VVDEGKKPVPVAAAAADRADAAGVEVRYQQADGGDADAALFAHRAQRRIEAGHLPFDFQFPLMLDDEVLKYLPCAAALFAHHEVFAAELVEADVLFPREGVVLGAEERDVVVHQMKAEEVGISYLPFDDRRVQLRAQQHLLYRPRVVDVAVDVGIRPCFGEFSDDGRHHAHSHGDGGAHAEGVAAHGGRHVVFKIFIGAYHLPRVAEEPFALLCDMEPFG